MAAYEKIRRDGPVRAEAHGDLQQAAEARGAQDFFYKADSLSAMMTERIRLGEQFALFLYVREFGIILYPRAVIVCYCRITFSRSY